jgi:predicted nucleotidyltransferase
MKDAKEYPNYKQALAGRDVILLATVGSTLLGMETKDSDVDEMGICVETPAQLLGFSPFEQDTYRTVVDRTGKIDAKSEPGDIDLVLYGLRKFVRLAVGGNPNLVQMLFIPKQMTQIYTELAAELQSIAPLFISKRTVKAFSGYMEAQKQRLLNQRGGMDVNRRDLVEKYGFDTKYAMHVLRLGKQGVEIGKNGKLQFPASPETVKFYRQVRTGEYSLPEVIQFVARYEEELQHYIQYAQLPDQPQYDEIEKWLVSVYQKHWNPGVNYKTYVTTVAPPPVVNPAADEQLPW